ncbi:TetR/AcrR family transcriptional regulator [Bacillus sp. CLL-7-23]|uniref:TetR/AcrR family transcriptional regulator n=1 Tax=Bacillus changyiensis TaxID=3004103 RepID=A0ABT4X3T7_9BACI|nr:TetR/AcrR family transcriptional regulator [Bacillus changyiensis]MDA7026772.1 TetR/AcrR family transcriptional regulator [Bacillus changyiensis]
MTEKEEKIIKAGLRLFAKKGFASTTVQDIVNECEISKGSFYLHFKSKDALLLAIIKYYIDRTMDNMKRIQEKHAIPKEIFKEQIAYQFKESKEQRDFILVMISEHSIPENSKIKEYFQKIGDKFHETYYEVLFSAYGDTCQPYLADLSIMVQGIVQSYQNLFIFHELDIDIDELASFIVRRVDEMIDGLLSNGEKPMLNLDIFYSYRNGQDHTDQMKILQEIDKLKKEVELPEDIIITLEVIEEELKKDVFRKPVIKGMLTNLEKQKNMQGLIERISHFLMDN